MDGGWQTRRGRQLERAARPIAEMDCRFPSDPIGDADARVEIDQIGTATEQDMLAVVELFAGGWFFKRTSASAKRPARFEKGDREARRLEGHRGRHAGEAAADD